MLLMGDRKTSIGPSIDPSPYSAMVVPFRLCWIRHLSLHRQDTMNFFFPSTSSPSEGIYSSRLENSPWMRSESLNVDQDHPNTRHRIRIRHLSFGSVTYLKDCFLFLKSIGIYSSCPPTRRVFSATAARQVYNLEFGVQDVRTLQLQEDGTSI